MMDIRSARNPAIVLAILASGDHAYYASDKGLHERQAESTPHEDFPLTVLEASSPERETDDVVDRAEPEVVVPTVRKRDLAHSVG